MCVCVCVCVFKLYKIFSGINKSNRKSIAEGHWKIMKHLEINIFKLFMGQGAGIEWIKNKYTELNAYKILKYVGYS